MSKRTEHKRAYDRDDTKNGKAAHQPQDQRLAKKSSRHSGLVQRTSQGNTLKTSYNNDTLAPTGVSRQAKHLSERRGKKQNIYIRRTKA